MLRPLIINADDFAYSEGVSRAVLDLLDRELVTSTSVMAAALGARDLLRRYSSSPSLNGRAGVHLQLTGGSPLSSRSECPELFSKDGSFRDPRFLTVRPSVSQVELEWRKQIDVVQHLLGVTPTHLDSHHGVHRLPDYFELYLQLAGELGVPVRGPGPDLMGALRSSGVAGSTAMIREWTGSGGGVEALQDVIAKAVIAAGPDDVIELITHPGIVDSDLLSRSSMSYTREIEYRALLDLTPERLRRVGVAMVTSRNSVR